MAMNGVSDRDTGEYWIVNQLLARGLHNSDDECLKYTTKMMDKLEEVRFSANNMGTVVLLTRPDEDETFKGRRHHG